MPKYTLTYFNAKARAEPSRYMFKLAGVDFEDRRIGGEEWAKFKPTTPLGQMPVLEVDGKQLCQSYAVHGYVASELGFYGANNWERGQIDEIIETGREMTPQVSAIFAEKDETKKAELKKKFETEGLPKIFGNAEKLLKRNDGGDGWFVGKKVSFADIQFFFTCHDFLPAFLGEQAELANFPKLAGLIKRVQELPEIAKWIKERPVTNM